MALARLLGRLNYIGEGSFSRVYEYDKNFVLKVPYDEDNGTIRPCWQRIRQARFIVGWTKILQDKLGPVITPVSYHIGGTVLQRRVTSMSYFELPLSVRHKATRWSDELIALAEKTCKELKSSGRIIDSNESNFRYDIEGRAVDWFDPVVPSDELFDSSEDVFANSDDNVR